MDDTNEIFIPNTWKFVCTEIGNVVVRPVQESIAVLVMTTVRKLGLVEADDGVLVQDDEEISVGTRVVQDDVDKFGVFDDTPCLVRAASTRSSSRRYRSPVFSRKHFVRRTSRRWKIAK